MGRSVLVLLMVLFTFCTASARTWLIRADGTGDAPTIQAGVDSSAAGDTVSLADGIYTGAGNKNIDYGGTPITVRSENGVPENCVIDCEGSAIAFHFRSGEGPNSVVEGVTVTHGLGGVAVSQYFTGPAVRNCVFLENYGTAINCIWPSGATIRACSFISNATSVDGGAYGGAVKWSGPGFLKINDCVFIGNSAFGWDSGWGGAVYLAGIYASLVDSCEFYGNEALAGGALCCFDDHVGDITNCIFSGNSADKGGAVYTYTGGGAFANCTFSDNSAPIGSSIAVEEGGWADLLGCILAYGTGGSAVYTEEDYGWPYLECCDIWGHTGGDWVGYIADQLGVRGNFSACPAFCNIVSEPYDLQLCSESPCLPGNHPEGYDCGLIGALGEGCTCGPTNIEPTTWGTIKGLYR
jgi:hypothetical protein